MNVINFILGLINLSLAAFLVKDQEVWSTRSNYLAGGWCITSALMPKLHFSALGYLFTLLGLLALGGWVWTCWKSAQGAFNRALWLFFMGCLGFPSLICFTMWLVEWFK